MKTSKRILSVVLAAAILLALAVPAMADTESAGVAYVTISDGTGIVLALAAVDLRDADEDGAVTINDALAIAHDAHCPGGYASATTEYGLSLTKLWNVENGTGYGYYFWLRKDCFMMDGMMGQFCMIFPEKDAVVAFDGSRRHRLQIVLHLRVWLCLRLYGHEWMLVEILQSGECLVVQNAYNFV